MPSSVRIGAALRSLVRLETREPVRNMDYTQVPGNMAHHLVRAHGGAGQCGDGRKDQGVDSIHNGTGMSPNRA